MKNLFSIFLIVPFLAFTTEVFSQNESTFIEHDIQEKNIMKTEILEKTKEVNEKNKTDLLTKDNKKIVSLMFSEKENSEIDRAIDSQKSNQIYVPEKLSNKSDDPDASKYENYGNQASNLHLSSIIYLDKDHWAIWINKKKIISEENNPSNEIYVDSITKDNISIIWAIGVSKWKALSGVSSSDDLVNVDSDGKVRIRFNLKPNQSFILSRNIVIEGKTILPYNSYLQKNDRTKKTNSENAQKEISEKSN
jgi:hypothetical protein